MKILLTGHRGYLGSALTYWLQKRGHQILGIDVKDHPNSNILQIRPQDFPDFNPDVILNFAGISGVHACEAKPEDAWNVNAEAPQRLARLWKSARFIQASTATVYSDVDSVYKQSKFDAEEYLKADADDRDAHTIICRFGTVFGIFEGNTPRWDLPLHAMVRDAVRKGEITVENGLATRPWLSIHRLVSTVTDLAETDFDTPYDQVDLQELAEYNLNFIDIAKRIIQKLPAKIRYLPGGTSEGYSLPLLLTGGDDLIGPEILKVAHAVSPLQTP